MNIRPATIDDLSTLQSISRITFAETFAHLNSEANMRKYMEKDLSTEKLGNELMNNNSSFYLAEENGETIGYLKLNECGTQSDINGTQSIEIERIYLLKSFHGLGVGKEMLDFAFSIARDRQKEVVWLGVWEKNHRAIAFYRKHGFAPYGTHIFRLGDEDQQDILMRISMR
jgi:ribosomal protein S18 acetylase RimI-like enzyme